MKSFTAGFAAALAAKGGSRPLWMLKITINGTDFHLSDQGLTISGWNNSNITTWAWVSQWGQLQEQISGGINEIRIADFSVTLVDDPDNNPYSMVPFATTYNLEASSVSLYLWFLGLNAATDPPVEMFRGFVRDIEIPDEFTVRLTIGDEADRMTGYATGQAVSLGEFPTMYADHVGRTVPIMFGAVTSVDPPCIAVDTVNNLRTYLVSRKPISSYSLITRIQGGTSTNITTIAEKYTGQPGSQLASFGDMALIRVSSKYVISASSPTTVTKRPVSVQNVNGNWSNIGNAYDGNAATAATCTAASSARFSFGPMGIPAGNISFTLQITHMTDAWPSMLFSFYASNGTKLYENWAAPLSGWPNPIQHINAFTLNNSNIDINNCYLDVVVFYQDAYPTPAIYDINMGITYQTSPDYGDADVAILVSADGGNTTIAAAAQALLSYGGVTATVSAPGVPGGNLVKGAIVEAATLRSWLNNLAFQHRCFFRMVTGTPKLIYRPDTLTSVATIAAVRVVNGAKVWRRSRVTLDNILNIINLRYDRDYSLSGDAAYKGMVTVNDASSRSAYGDHERPELFRCDLLGDATWAATVAAWYLTYYKTRRWLHEFETFLDYGGLEFGDIITLGFAGSAVGVVVSVGITPGSESEPDRVALTVMV